MNAKNDDGGLALLLLLRSVADTCTPAGLHRMVCASTTAVPTCCTDAACV